MSDSEEIKKIQGFDETELLDYVMVYPEHLTDGYYSRFRAALWKRYEQLVKERKK